MKCKYYYDGNQKKYKLTKSLRHFQPNLKSLFLWRFDAHWSCENGHPEVQSRSFDKILIDITRDRTGNPVIGERPLEWHLLQHLGGLQELHSCDSCPGNQGVKDCNVRFTFTQTPQYMLIQMQSVDVVTGEKIRKVSVPLVLELSQHFAGEGLFYKLNTTVFHIGASTESGHYITTSRAPNGEVYRTNDSVVEIADEDWLTYDRTSCTDPYIVTYERCSEHEYCAIAVADDLLNDG